MLTITKNLGNNYMSFDDFAIGIVSSAAKEFLSSLDPENKKMPKSSAPDSLRKLEELRAKLKIVEQQRDEALLGKENAKHLVFLLQQQKSEVEESLAKTKKFRHQNEQHLRANAERIAAERDEAIEALQTRDAIFFTQEQDSTLRDENSRLQSENDELKLHVRELGTMVANHRQSLTEALDVSNQHLERAKTAEINLNRKIEEHRRTREQASTEVVGE
jgi:hypothetical protein